MPSLTLRARARTSPVRAAASSVAPEITFVVTLCSWLTLATEVATPKMTARLTKQAQTTTQA